MTTTEFDMEKFGFVMIDPTPRRDIYGRFRKRTSCCICGGELGRFGGHNPEPFMPYTDDGCCSDCDAIFVLPARMREAATA